MHSITCRACGEAHHIQKCPQIWAHLRAGPEADVCISCGDDLGRSGPGTCAACLEYEGAEQRAHDRAWVDRANARTRALLAERVPGAPF